MRRSLVIATVLLAITFVFIGGPSLLFSPSTDNIVPEEEDDTAPEIITLEDSESGFWPYLNAQESHEKRSPLNVIVRGDPDETIQLLIEHGDGDWEETDHDHFDADELIGLAGNETVTENETNGTVGSHEGDQTAMTENGTENETTADRLRPVSPTDIPWSHADGTTRYAYLDPGPDEDAYWTTETLQLEDGEYYGYRYHIRAYESPNPDDQWMVLQTHSEHFDWFTLRHRVDGVEEAQSRLEADLTAIPGVDELQDIRRINLRNDGPSDSNGWATKADLTAMAALPIAIGLAARRGRDVRTESVGVLERANSEVDDHLTEVDRVRLRAAADRLEANHLVLAATIIALVLGVRMGGIALDRSVDSFTAHMIAGGLYPLIAIGIPVATYVIASGLERRLDAAVAASLSLAVAIWLDYGLMGVDVLPIDVIVQRMLVVVALGLIAAGAAKRATGDSRVNDLVAVGVAMWVLVLGGTLFGYL